MMATRRINAATTWLIRAFSPGCLTMLRSWASVPVWSSHPDHRRHRAGELLTIFFDLPDQPAFTRALELERSAGALRQIRIGKNVIHDLTAKVSGEHRTLRIEALLGTDEEWGNA
jgi:hypothetical protein